MVFFGKSAKFSVQSSAIDLVVSRSNCWLSESILKTSRTDAARFLVEATSLATKATRLTTLGSSSAAASATVSNGCVVATGSGVGGVAGIRLRWLTREGRMECRELIEEARVFVI